MMMHIMDRLLLILANDVEDIMMLSNTEILIFKYNMSLNAQNSYTITERNN